MSSSLSAAQPRSPGRSYPPPGRPEHAWPAFSSIIVAIVMQLLLPTRLTEGPKWVVPALEAVLLAGLVISTPTHVTGVHQARRRLALFLTALVSIANISSLVLLSHALLQHGSPNPRALMSAGALIWLTNVIIFGLWYWVTDRGGPGMRAAGVTRRQTCSSRRCPMIGSSRQRWRPQFVDYLYVSLTNALALQPDRHDAADVRARRA